MEYEDVMRRKRALDALCLVPNYNTEEWLSIIKTIKEANVKMVRRTERNNDQDE